MAAPRAGREDRSIAESVDSRPRASSEERRPEPAGERTGRGRAGAHGWGRGPWHAGGRGPWHAGGEWPPYPWWGRHGPRRVGRRHPLGRLLRGGPLRRSDEHRMIAGVGAALAERLGFDVTVVRVALVLFGLASGMGVAAYVLAWLLLPLEGRDASIASRAVSDVRGLGIAVAFLPALVLTLIVAGALHLGALTTMSWPLFLSAAGLVLVWRNAEDDERAWLRRTAEPLFRLGTGGRSRRSFAARVGGGGLLLLAGLAVLVLGHTSTNALRPLGGALLVVAAFVLLFGPWWLSLARDLVAERQARARAEERADMAARVHDSVLQTLALIQRSAADPQRVVQLARTQERELRSWLFDGQRPGSFGEQDATTLAAGVLAIERDVEAAHGVAVESVTVGDCPLTDALRELLAAAREATVNAAKWSGAPVVSLFAEAEPDRVTLFVRDRGCGFDTDAVPADRRGVAESIRGRMARHGGSAVVRSAPGAGTEVELAMPRAADRRAVPG